MSSGRHQGRCKHKIFGWIPTKVIAAASFVRLPTVLSPLSKPLERDIPVPHLPHVTVQIPALSALALSCFSILPQYQYIFMPTGLQVGPPANFFLCASIHDAINTVRPMLFEMLQCPSLRLTNRIRSRGRSVITTCPTRLVPGVPKSALLGMHPSQIETIHPDIISTTARSAPSLLLPEQL